MAATKRLAKIEDTLLGYEDHGMLTYILDLAYGGSASHQGAGLVILSGENTDKHIRGVLSACGVSQWEKLRGRTIFAYSDYCKVYALEPLPTEPGKRFAIIEGFDEWQD